VGGDAQVDVVASDSVPLIVRTPHPPRGRRSSSR